MEINSSFHLAKKRLEKILIRTVHFSTILIFFIVGCSKQQESVSIQQRTSPKVTGVTVETVKIADVQDSIEVSGTVHARTSAMVSTRIPGVISVLKAREGDRVKKGALLIQLDAEENKATAAVATAGIEDARHALNEATVQKKFADSNLERYQHLYKDQVISRQEFEIKQTEHELANQAVLRAQARFKQAEQTAKAATTVADYTRIVAPISGVIISKQADLGGSVFPGQPIMTIEDERSYQLELSIPETMISKIKAGSILQISLDAFNTPFNAKIAEIVPAADPASRTFTAKVNLTQNGIKSGLFGRGTIPLGTSAKGITIPKAALVERGALLSIWVVDKNNIAQLRLVKTGKNYGKLTEVLSGLSEGERVAVSGIEKITEGAKVE